MAFSVFFIETLLNIFDSFVIDLFIYKIRKVYQIQFGKSYSLNLTDEKLNASIGK